MSMRDMRCARRRPGSIGKGAASLSVRYCLRPQIRLGGVDESAQGGLERRSELRRHLTGWLDTQLSRDVVALPDGGLETIVGSAGQLTGRSRDLRCRILTPSRLGPPSSQPISWSRPAWLPLSSSAKGSGRSRSRRAGCAGSGRSAPEGLGLLATLRQMEPVPTQDRGQQIGDRVDETAVRLRVQRLLKPVMGPFRRSALSRNAGFIVAPLTALIVGIASHQPILGGLVGVVAVVLVTLPAWLPYAEPTYRRAAELYFDHERNDRADWLQANGAPEPRSLEEAERWLASHPASYADRASLLLALGRLDEADAAITAIRPVTPGDAVFTEILRQTRLLYLGSIAGLGPLDDEWRALTDPVERHRNRACLAFLHAQLAVDMGRDPVDELAAGRADLASVDSSVRTHAQMLKLFGPGVALVVVAAALSAIVSA